MRIVSLVPSATEILCALGLQDEIVGISHACDWPPAVSSRPRVTATRLSPDLNSLEIDKKVREGLSSGHSLYAIDARLLQSLRPDLVITQEQCVVCAVDQDRAVCATDNLGIKTNVLSLSSFDFAGLWRDIINVGSATGQVKQAESLADELATQLEGIAQRTTSLTRPRVFCLSWFDPLMAAGAWISEMIGVAGGHDGFGAGKASSSPIAVDCLLSQPPEVIFLLPCSFSQDQSSREWSQIRDLPPWRELPAVREGRVFSLESSLFHRQGPRMVDGVELMASLLHPKFCCFESQGRLSRKVA